MSAFFLYHRTTSPTGRLLAKALGISYGHLGPGQTPRRARSIQSSLSRAERIIRWGSQQALPFGCPCEHTLNTERPLSIASDKLRTLATLTEAGVSTCPWLSRTGTGSVSSLGELREASPEGVVLGRSCHGSKGRDIRVFAPGQDPTGCELYTAYIPNTREYRLHVFRGEVIRVQGKYLDFPEQHTNPYIKNYGQGFRFRTPDRELHSNRLEAAIAAVAALGLDFGAVDLLVGMDKKPYVLEVNTAPACSPLTARAYIEKFAWWLGVTPNYAALPASRADEHREARAAVLAFPIAAGR